MRKFLAVVKREYVQRVRAKMFIVSTVFLPLIMSLFGLVPAIILNIDAGSVMRVAVVDQTGKMYEHLSEALTNDESSQESSVARNTNDGRTFGSRPFGKFVLEEVSSDQPADQIRTNLERRLLAKELDGYMILPP